jgi:PAS domain S-box-containing protein
MAKKCAPSNQDGSGSTGTGPTGTGPATPAGGQPADDIGYKLLFDQHPSPMWVMERESGAFLDVNQAAIAHYGWSRAEFLAKHLQDIRPPEDVPRLKRHFAEHPADRPYQGRWRHRIANGTLIQVEVTSSAVQFAGRACRLVMIRDVTALERTEEDLRLSQAHLHAVFDNLPFDFWVCDAEGRYVMQNGASVTHIGECLGLPVADINLPPEVRAAWAEDHRRALAGEVVRGERAHPRPGGGTRHVHEILAPIIDQGRVLGTLGIHIDISERKQLEDELRQAQKMEAIGRLAGGIAHDFNNLLTAILGYGELLVARSAADTPPRQYAEQIVRSARRAGELTRQLLAFSRKQVLQPRLIELDQVVREISPLLARLLGPAIVQDFRVPSGIWQVRADAAQIEQVLMNLAVNARDAMPGGGRLEMLGGNLTVSPATPAPEPDMTGEWAFLTVEDSGAGIPPEVLPHIFEPFFTTKALHHGTGLGLSTAYGIVRQSGGRLTVTSTPGRGARFTVWLPRAAAANRVSTPMDIDDPTPPRRPMAVLVVEDEADIRNLMIGALSGAGYVVHATANGAEALAHLAGPGAVDLLLTDLLMPAIGGGELVRRARQMRPGLRVLVLSGYPGEQFSDGGPAADTPFLAKPFTTRELLRRVGDVLKGM